jgi:hypothetical protein
VGYALTPAHGERGELAELHERVSDGYAGHSVLWLGLIVALVAVIGIRALLGRLRGEHGRGVGAGCFFVLPLLAYSLQESLERLMNAESFPFQALLEPRFLVGLALQLPFAVVAFLLGWLLFQTGRRLLRLLARRPPSRLRTLPVRLWARAAVALPRVRPLSPGHPLRGPPLLA